jgi:hypothetical protein
VATQSLQWQFVGFGRFLNIFLLLLPAAGIIALAAPRFFSGWAMDEAFPVPTYIAMNYALPQKSYDEAAHILTNTDRRDGGARIMLAEAAADARLPPVQVIPLLREGLERLPTSARGWTLLASEYLAVKERTSAARSLSFALVLGRYDYWIAGRRAQLAASLWSELSADDRKTGEAEAALLWEADILHNEIPALLRTEGGPQLIDRALSGNPDEIRALNRWVAEHELNMHQ